MTDGKSDAEAGEGLECEHGDIAGMCPFCEFNANQRGLGAGYRMGRAWKALARRLRGDVRWWRRFSAGGIREDIHAAVVSQRNAARTALEAAQAREAESVRVAMEVAGEHHISRMMWGCVGGCRWRAPEDANWAEARRLHAAHVMDEYRKARR